MAMTHHIKVIDDGEYGARLEAPEGQKPSCTCPGLGGWSRFDGGWFARVKGQQAADILARVNPEFPYGSMNANGHWESY